MSEAVCKAFVRTIGKVLIVTLVGCTPTTPEQTSPLVTRTQRDGAEVVEYDRLPLAATWSLEDEPLLTIGDNETAAQPYLFSWIGAIHPRPDGALLVVERRVPEVRVFDADGTFEQAFGGKGEGPGEFESIWVTRLVGDRFLAWDRRSRRLTTFTAEGELLDTRRLPTLGDTPSDEVRGFFGDGAVLAAIVDQPWPPGAGVVETRNAFLRWSPSGGAGELFVHVNRNLFKSSDGTARVIPLTPELDLEAGADAVYVAPGEFLGYQRYGADGRLEMIVRANEASPPIDPQFLEEFQRRQIEAAPPGVAGRLRLAYAEMSFRERLPMSDRLFLDDDENVWVRRYRLPGDESPQVWHVFDRDGAFLGTLHVPHRFEPRAATADRLIGVWRDEMDVQSVSVVSLQRR